MESISILLDISQVIWLISTATGLCCERHSLFISFFIIIEISKWDSVISVLVNLLHILRFILFAGACFHLLHNLGLRLFWGFLFLCGSSWSGSLSFWLWLFSWGSRCWSWCLFLFLCCWLSFWLLSISWGLLLGISCGSCLFFSRRVFGSFLLISSLLSLLLLFLLNFITCLFLDNFELFSNHQFSL